jgi:LPXTG-motif cell wall-anchored protein
VVVNGTIALHANALEPDGQELSYRWSLCGQRAEPLSREDSVTFTPSSAAPGSTATIHVFEVCVEVFDGIDGVDSQRLNVSVTAVPPPTEPPNIAGIGIDTGAIALILVAAAAVLLAALFIRKRRRAPPANL